jgi:hypothetical protein
LIAWPFNFPMVGFPMNRSKPETEPTRDEVAKKAYFLYLEEGRPQGHDVQNWLEAGASVIDCCYLSRIFFWVRTGVRTGTVTTFRAQRRRRFLDGVRAKRGDSPQRAFVPKLTTP